MIRVELVRIMIQEDQHAQVIVLREREGNRGFPIVIGIFEALAIKRKVDGDTLLRPLTHDLLTNVIQAMGGELTRMVVTDLKDVTFYAKLVIRRDGGDLEVDSRPSDAIALAVQNGSEIYVEDHVMDLVGKEM